MKVWYQGLHEQGFLGDKILYQTKLADFDTMYDHKTDVACPIIFHNCI